MVCGGLICSPGQREGECCCWEQSLWVGQAPALGNLPERPGVKSRQAQLGGSPMPCECGQPRRLLDLGGAVVGGFCSLRNSRAPGARLLAAAMPDQHKVGSIFRWVR